MSEDEAGQPGQPAEPGLPGQPATEEAPVFPIKRKRRGGVIGAAMMGLEQALYGPRQNEIVVVADADGMPEPDFDIDLTPDPRDSTVRFRRLWWHKHS